jgi:hypothetical protein
MYEPAAPADLQQGCILGGVYFPAIQDRRRGVVVTPACDLVVDQNEVAFVTLCAIHPAHEAIAGVFLPRLLANGQGHRLVAPADRDRVERDVLGKLKEIARKRYNRYHLLAPPPGNRGRVVIDFTIVTSYPTEDARVLDRPARLASPYRKDVAARYAAYILRPTGRVNRSARARHRAPDGHMH